MISKGTLDRSQTVETSERCGSETSLPLHTHVTCSLWSSCWAAGRTTAAAACEPPPRTAALAGTPRRIWQCVPAPSWRAASAYPDTCPSLPAGTAPTSRCGRTWREDIYGSFKSYFVKGAAEHCSDEWVHVIFTLYSITNCFQDLYSYLRAYKSYKCTRASGYILKHTQTIAFFLACVKRLLKHLLIFLFWDSRHFFGIGSVMVGTGC